MSTTVNIFVSIILWITSFLIIALIIHIIYLSILLIMFSIIEKLRKLLKYKK